MLISMLVFHPSRLLPSRSGHSAVHWLQNFKSRTAVGLLHAGCHQRQQKPNCTLQEHQQTNMRIAFLHPDLGLGGAERLIVDAAAELVAAGHTVDVFTAYYDANRCFEETKTAGFSVTVAGGWFPRHVAGRLTALCAYIRCLLVAIYIAWASRSSQAAYQVIIVDQVSVVVPLLHAFTRSKVLFYCHFPDLLLATRQSRLKRAYRAPIDWLEQTTTGQADLVLVNSKFTQATFASTFTRLSTAGVVPEVLYPAVPVPTDEQLQSHHAGWQQQLSQELVSWISQGPLILSINRFERKKGLGLAVEALHELRASQQHQAGGTRLLKARLLLAGGWDARLAENVEHLQELQKLVESLNLGDYVRFLPSFTDPQRAALLAACEVVVYTPQLEHFGIVPIEAMAAGRPVIAVNNGGPVESIAGGTTGLLCDPTPAAFAAAYQQLLSSPEHVKQMGAAARKRVLDCFSRKAFGARLDGYVKGLAA